MGAKKCGFPCVLRASFVTTQRRKNRVVTANLRLTFQCLEPASPGKQVGSHCPGVRQKWLN